jgi:hypothetical protein
MLAAGVELKIVQETLGHVSSTFTRDTYTSVYPEVARAGAESTAALLATSAPPPSAPPLGPDGQQNSRRPGRARRTASHVRLSVVPDR